jgi:hypothetical protein
VPGFVYGGRDSPLRQWFETHHEVDSEVIERARDRLDELDDPDDPAALGRLLGIPEDLLRDEWLVVDLDLVPFVWRAVQSTAPGGVSADDFMSAYDAYWTVVCGALGRGNAMSLWGGGVGRESTLESWLAANLDALGLSAPIELAASPYGRQWRHPGGRADLICRVTHTAGEFRSGDFVVIELKATVADPPCLAQLDRYCDALADDLQTLATVHGMIVADGFTPALIDAVVAAPNRYIATLVEVGYYDALFGTGFLDGEQGEFPPFMTTG